MKNHTYNVFVYGISYRILFGSKPLRIRSDISNYLLLKNMMLFSIELDILLIKKKSGITMVFS